MGQEGYESAADLRERNRDRNLGATQEAPVEASSSAMEYIAALEESLAIHNRKIAEL